MSKEIRINTLSAWPYVCTFIFLTLPSGATSVLDPFVDAIMGIPLLANLWFSGILMNSVYT